MPLTKYCDNGQKSLCLDPMGLSHHSDFSLCLLRVNFTIYSKSIGLSKIERFVSDVTHLFDIIIGRPNLPENFRGKWFAAICRIISSEYNAAFEKVVRHIARMKHSHSKNELEFRSILWFLCEETKLVFSTSMIGTSGSTSTLEYKFYDL